MPALEATAVCRTYGKGSAHTDVLRDFSLKIEDGEFVALMGPSGSGKSTFIHLAAGLIAPDSGSICVAGTDVAKLSDSAAARFRRRNEGIVFQDFNLLASLDVTANITLGAKLDHAKIDRARLAELIDKLGLEGTDRKHPAELSGGERQRVAIARALYMRPALVLADEPTGNLDINSARTICALLAELNKSEKSAILLVTHDPVVAACASRVAFLKDGRIVSTHQTSHDPSSVSKLYLECFG